MSEKKRIRKKWTGKDGIENIDEAIELLNTIKDNLIATQDKGEPYYELIGIKTVNDVEE